MIKSYAMDEELNELIVQKSKVDDRSESYILRAIVKKYFEGINEGI